MPSNAVKLSANGQNIIARESGGFIDITPLMGEDRVICGLRVPGQPGSGLVVRVVWQPQSVANGRTLSFVDGLSKSGSGVGPTVSAGAHPIVTRVGARVNYPGYCCATLVFAPELGGCGAWLLQ